MDRRSALVAFFLRVLGTFFGLAVITALIGIGVRAWAPGVDVQVLQAIALHRSSSLTSVAQIVSDAGSFALLAPLSIAFVLLRRWKRPADDIALVVIAAGSAALPSVVKLIVARPRPTIEHLSHLTSLSFPSEHTTQAAAIYLTIAILLSRDLNRGWRELVVVLAVLIALAVAWSRVYLGVHFPTDVIAGLLLGWSWALFVFHWARPKLAEIQPPPGPSAERHDPLVKR
ncbi:MAG: phosphatase PAP2 family protein [Chloroflexi bacterium]|nr:MAG: phosphatase PAP2 family protein [Chloroflexota bacterium]